MLKVVVKGEMNDFNLIGGFGDRRTDGQTFALLESLSRLKSDSRISMSVHSFKPL